MKWFKTTVAISGIQHTRKVQMMYPERLASLLSFLTCPRSLCARDGIIQTAPATSACGAAVCSSTPPPPFPDAGEVSSVVSCEVLDSTAPSFSAADGGKVSEVLFGRSSPSSLFTDDWELSAATSCWTFGSTPPSSLADLTETSPSASWWVLDSIAVSSSLFNGELSSEVGWWSFGSPITSCGASLESSSIKVTLVSLDISVASSGVFIVPNIEVNSSDVGCKFLLDSFSFGFELPLSIVCCFSASFLILVFVSSFLCFVSSFFLTGGGSEPLSNIFRPCALTKRKIRP